ncbi:hypothetical protein R3P38DRAFT_1851811 [Favolaschia claudopus]|uniref:Uncharacterized protein n=1 Tax=Favolaschia claudopus TaxID=2862362 RepID=A0AAW0D5Q1_9AGAR
MISFPAAPPVGVDIIEISDSDEEPCSPLPRKRKREPRKRDDAPRKRPRARSVSVISINSTGNEVVAPATFEDVSMTDYTDNVDIDGMAHMGLDDPLAPEQDLISNAPPPEPEPIVSILPAPSSLLSPSPVWTESHLEDARYFNARLASVARELDKASEASPPAEDAHLSLPIAAAAPSFVPAVPPPQSTSIINTIPSSPSPSSPHIAQPNSPSPPPQWLTSTRFLAPPPPRYIPALATRLAGQLVDGHLPGKPFYKKYSPAGQTVNAHSHMLLPESVSEAEAEPDLVTRPQAEVQVAQSNRDAPMPFHNPNPNPNSAQPPTTDRPVPKTNPCNGYSPPPVSPRSDSTLGTPPSAISVVLPVSVSDLGPSFVKLKHVEIVISSHSNSTASRAVAALPITFNASTASPLKHVDTASDTELIDDDDLELLYPPTPSP